jgi:predicted transposase YdaD
LGVFPDGPCKSVTVQICWLDEVDDPSTYSEMLSELNSWLDSWLDQNKFIGTVDITFAE